MSALQRRHKRVVFVVMAVFLGLNGYDLATSESDVVTTVVALAAGNVDEAELAEWVRGRIRKRPSAAR